MTKEEVFSFVKENPTCFLATVEGDAPRVRGMRMYGADERGIMIQISSVKDVYKEIARNPKVELCFNDLTKGVQVRVRGTAEFLEDQSVKEEVLKARPFLKSLVDAHGLDVIKVFRVADATASVWTMQTNLEPKTSVKLT
jgi:pyridoxamine 5'-phosphate oxidase